MRAPFAALLLCVACASDRPRVVQIGPDAFRVTRIARDQSATYDTLRAEAMRAADGFCHRQEKIVEVLLVEDSGPAFGTVKGYTASQVEFRCVPKPKQSRHSEQLSPGPGSPARRAA
jgi:hypothetical protein